MRDNKKFSFRKIKKKLKIAITNKPMKASQFEMEEFKLPFKQDQCKQPNVVDNVSRESLEYILNLTQNDLEILINNIMENSEDTKTSAIEEVNQIPSYDSELSNKALIPTFSNETTTSSSAENLEILDNQELASQTQLHLLDPELNLPMILSQTEVSPPIQSPNIISNFLPYTSELNLLNDETTNTSALNEVFPLIEISGSILPYSENIFPQSIVGLTSDDQSSIFQYSGTGNSQLLNTFLNEENNTMYEGAIQGLTPSQPLVSTPNSLLMYPRLNNEEDQSSDSFMAPNLANDQSLSSLVVDSSLIHSELKTDDENRRILKALTKNFKSKQTKAKRLNEKKHLKHQQ